ncbi:hypothetical protein SRHO_G00084630 [Serrasalmus rhombeus]
MKKKKKEGRKLEEEKRASNASKLAKVGDHFGFHQTLRISTADETDRARLLHNTRSGTYRGEDKMLRPSYSSCHGVPPWFSSTCPPVERMKKWSL